MSKKIVSRIIPIILIMMMAVSTIIIIYTTFTKNKPSIFGYRLFIVKSGSMYDTLDIGDLIITKKVDKEKLKVGDVITFISSQKGLKGLVITHRIVKIEGDFYYTKGDAAKTVDEAPVEYKDILGTLTVSSAFAGKFLGWLAKPVSMIFLIALPIILIVILEIKNKNIRLSRFFKRKIIGSDDDDERSILQLLLNKKHDSVLPENLLEMANDIPETTGDPQKEPTSGKMLAMASWEIYLDKQANRADEDSAFSIKSNCINLGGFQMANVKFNNQLRGYNCKEVEEYIEKVHKEYVEVCGYLQDKIKSLEASVGSQEDVANAMIRAQSVARLIEEEGRQKAAGIISEAEVKAQSILAMAEVEAGRFVREASESRDKIRGEMQQVFNIASMFLKEVAALEESKNEEVITLEYEAYK